jgi:hypothetical protein
MPMPIVEVRMNLDGSLWCSLGSGCARRGRAGSEK